MATALTLELLSWIDSRRRTYSEVMDVWRTSCPRHSIWEDALADGLVARCRDEVSLTPTGRAMLDARSRSKAQVEG